MNENNWNGILLVVGNHMDGYDNVPGTKCRILVLRWSLRNIDGMQNILDANSFEVRTNKKEAKDSI